VSHGERVIDATTGITKLDLVRYYESVAEFILPHLKGRPCSLVRGPPACRQLFFQKHGEKIGIPGITELPEALWPGHASLLEVGNAQGAGRRGAMNVIEFHTWNSMAKAIDKPDRMIFDLDPGEGTTWEHIQEAATLVRAMLRMPRPGGVVEDQRRQGPARGGAAGAAPTTTTPSRGSRRPSCSTWQDDSRALRGQAAGRATASESSSWTTCATGTARRRPRPSRRVRGRAWACRCRCRGTTLQPLKSGAQWTWHRARTPVVPDSGPLGRLLEDAPGAWQSR
jgi:hypothetical protein